MKFRVLAIGLAGLGIVIGVAFGAGLAMGKGNPREVQTGLSAAQIQQLYGASAAGGTGNAAGGTGRGSAATSGAAGATGATGSAAGTASVNLGTITAVEGSTVTIETSQGATKLNLSPATKVTKMTDGTAADLQAGILVSYSGTPKSDGSIDVTSVSNVPMDLQSLVARGGNRQGAPAAGPTPTP